MSGKATMNKTASTYNDWQHVVLPPLPFTGLQIESYLDLNGNIVHYFELPEEHKKLVIESRSVVKHPRGSISKFPLWGNLSSLSKMEGVPE